MISTFLLIGILLLVVNFIFVFFIQEDNSFAKFPGIISFALFAVFSGYLILDVLSVTPEIVVKDVKPGVHVPVKIPAIGNQHALTPDEIRSKELMEKDQAIQERGQRVMLLCLFMNLMILQSIYAIIAALVGIKLLPYMKEFYKRIIVVHVILVVIFGAVEYVLRHL
jgi:hypothetical protein